MKKIIIAILAISMPLFVNAQSSGLFSKKKIKMQQDVTAYMAGAVPQISGNVEYSTTISAPGKSKEELYKIALAWATLRYEANQGRGEWTDADFFSNIEDARISKYDKSIGYIQCRGAEEMIFSNKALAKDYTHVFYLVDLNVKDGAIDFKMHNISYLYVGGSERPERVTAEEWITDDVAFNKKGELHRITGKFRIKTVDLKDELIKELKDAVK